MQNVRLAVGACLMVVWVGSVFGAVFTRDAALIGLATAITGVLAAPLGFLFSSALQEAARREVQARGEEQLAEFRRRADPAGRDAPRG